MRHSRLCQVIAGDDDFTLRSLGFDDFDHLLGHGQAKLGREVTGGLRGTFAAGEDENVGRECDQYAPGFDRPTVEIVGDSGFNSGLLWWWDDGF